MKRYIRAYNTISVETFYRLVDIYRDSDYDWSYIVDKLKGSYGLEIAEAIADDACNARK